MHLVLRYIGQQAYEIPFRKVLAVMIGLTHIRYINIAVIPWTAAAEATITPFIGGQEEDQQRGGRCTHVQISCSG